MRVAAPRPNTALRLFEHGNKPCQRTRVETGRYRNAPTAGQFYMKACTVVPRLLAQQRPLDQFNRNKRDSRGAVRGETGILHMTWVASTLPAIVVQRRQGKAMLTAKYPSRQTALFILQDQPIRFFPAPATTCARCLRFHHEPSTSSSEIRGKNGLARRGTIDSPEQIDPGYFIPRVYLRMLWDPRILSPTQKVNFTANCMTLPP